MLLCTAYTASMNRARFGFTSLGTWRALALLCALWCDNKLWIICS